MKPITGDPKVERISTSHIERANLTLRMQLRRFTRLTNGFSKKLINLEATVAVFMAWYNFCRVHHTLRVTPAMEAGLTDHIWTIRELLTAETDDRRQPPKSGARQRKPDPLLPPITVPFEQAVSRLLRVKPAPTPSRKHIKKRAN